MSSASPSKGFSSSLAIAFRYQKKNTWLKVNTPQNGMLSVQLAITRGDMHQCSSSIRWTHAAYGGGKNTLAIFFALWKCCIPIERSWKTCATNGAEASSTPDLVASMIRDCIHWKTSSDLRGTVRIIWRLSLSTPCASTSSKLNALSKVQPSLFSSSARINALSMLKRRTIMCSNSAFSLIGASDCRQKAVNVLAASNHWPIIE
mmetsp:Transcript_82032/g.232258  ORF Transcript_82032/g.232258 Transcript_82032/m.232258 type:complete len:204 (-) Transcript_82032:389-1000(-)